MNGAMGSHRALGVRFAAAGVASVFLITSCQSGSHAATTPDGRTYAIPATQAEMLDLAKQIIIRDCMESHGFRYWVIPHRMEKAQRDFPYVIDDVNWAKRHGYGRDIQDKQEQRAKRDPNQRYFWSLSSGRRAAATRAMNGPPFKGMSIRLPNGILVGHSKEGCDTESDAKLYGNAYAWFRASRVTDSLAGLRIGQVTSDPRYGAAVQKWSHCMLRGGYQFRTPTQSRMAANETKSPLPRDREIAAAIAEATCATQSQLSSVTKQLDTKYRSKQQRQYTWETSARERLAHEALPRARAVIAQG
ncbi:hypothetical protein [Streptomyces hokutonensis]|uniref:hypothetical protein n=1 Tax=Streptomyces hokutonensis TaxID=1306990 RepID=UPI0033DE06AF